MKKIIIPVLLLAVIVLVVALLSKSKMLPDAPAADTVSPSAMADPAVVPMQAPSQPPPPQPSAEDKARAAAIVVAVQKHIDIDVSVEPTVATIVDAAKLQAQSQFYKNAVNGDFLVVTPTRAILYSKTRDRIIDVTPVEIKPQPSSQKPPQQTTSAAAR